MSVPVVFNTLNIGGQYTNATVSIGENMQSGWNAPSKNNFAIGPAFGMNLAISPANFVFDPDGIDTRIIDPEFIPSFQTQQV